MKMQSTTIVTGFLNELDEEIMAGRIPPALRTRVIELTLNPEQPLCTLASDIVYEDHESGYHGDYRVSYGPIDELCTRIDEIAQMARHLTFGRYASTAGADLRAALIQEAQAICQKRVERYDRKPKAVETRRFTPVREWLRSRYSDRIVQMEIHLSVLDQIAPHHITGYMRTVDGWAQHRMHCATAARIRRDFRRHTRNLKFVG